MLPNNKATKFLLCVLLLDVFAPQLSVGAESSAPQPGTVPAQQGRQDGKGRSMASGSSAAASGGTQKGVAGQVVDTLKGILHEPHTWDLATPYVTLGSDAEQAHGPDASKHAPAKPSMLLQQAREAARKAATELSKEFQDFAKVMSCPSAWREHDPAAYHALHLDDREACTSQTHGSADTQTHGSAPNIQPGLEHAQAVGEGEVGKGVGLLGLNTSAPLASFGAAALAVQAAARCLHQLANTTYGTEPSSLQQAAVEPMQHAVQHLQAWQAWVHSPSLSSHPHPRLLRAISRTLAHAGHVLNDALDHVIEASGYGGHGASATAHAMLHHAAQQLQDALAFMRIAAAATAGLRTTATAPATANEFAPATAEEHAALDKHPESHPWLSAVDRMLSVLCSPSTAALTNIDLSADPAAAAAAPALPPPPPVGALELALLLAGQPAGDGVVSQQQKLTQQEVGADSAAEVAALSALPADLQVACLHEGLASLEASMARSSNLAAYAVPSTSAEAAKWQAEYEKVLALLNQAWQALHSAEAGASAPTHSKVKVESQSCPQGQKIEKAVADFFTARAAVTSLLAVAPRTGSSSQAGGSSRHSTPMETGMHQARETKFWLETLLQPVLQPIMHSAQDAWSVLTGRRNSAAQAHGKDAQRHTQQRQQQHGASGPGGGRSSAGSGVQAAALSPPRVPVLQQGFHSSLQQDANESISLNSQQYPSVTSTITKDSLDSAPPASSKRQKGHHKLSRNGHEANASAPSKHHRHHAGFWNAVIQRAEHDAKLQQSVTHGSVDTPASATVPPVWNGSHMAAKVNAADILSFAIRSPRSMGRVLQPVPPSLPFTGALKDCPPVPPLHAAPPPLDVLHQDVITGWGVLQSPGGKHIESAAGAAKSGRAAELPRRPDGPPPPHLATAHRRSPLSGHGLPGVLRSGVQGMTRMARLVGVHAPDDPSPQDHACHTNEHTGVTECTPLSQQHAHAGPGISRLLGEHAQLTHGSAGQNADNVSIQQEQLLTAQPKSSTRSKRSRIADMLKHAGAALLHGGSVHGELNHGSGRARGSDPEADLIRSAVQAFEAASSDFDRAAEVLLSSYSELEAEDSAGPAALPAPQAPPLAAGNQSNTAWDQVQQYLLHAGSATTEVLSHGRAAVSNVAANATKGTLHGVSRAAHGAGHAASDGIHALQYSAACVGDACKAAVHCVGDACLTAVHCVGAACSIAAHCVGDACNTVGHAGLSAVDAAAHAVADPVVHAASAIQHATASMARTAGRAVHGAGDTIADSHAGAATSTRHGATNIRQNLQDFLPHAQHAVQHDLTAAEHAEEFAAGLAGQARDAVQDAAAHAAKVAAGTSQAAGQAASGTLHAGSRIATDMGSAATGATDLLKHLSSAGIEKIRQVDHGIQESAKAALDAASHAEHSMQTAVHDAVHHADVGSSLAAEKLLQPAAATVTALGQMAGSAVLNGAHATMHAAQAVAEEAEDAAQAVKHVLGKDQSMHGKDRSTQNAFAWAWHEVTFPIRLAQAAWQGARVAFKVDKLLSPVHWGSMVGLWATKKAASQAVHEVGHAVQHAGQSAHGAVTQAGLAADQAVRHAVDDAVHGVEQAKEHAVHGVQQAHEHAVHRAQQAKEHAVHGAQRLKERAVHGAHHLEQKVAHVVGETTEHLAKAGNVVVEGLTKPFTDSATAHLAREAASAAVHGTQSAAHAVADGVHRTAHDVKHAAKVLAESASHTTHAVLEACGAVVDGIASAAQAVLCAAEKVKDAAVDVVHAAADAAKQAAAKTAESAAAAAHAVQDACEAVQNGVATGAQKAICTAHHAAQKAGHAAASLAHGTADACVGAACATGHAAAHAGHVVKDAVSSSVHGAAHVASGVLHGAQHLAADAIRNAQHAAITMAGACKGTACAAGGAAADTASAAHDATAHVMGSMVDGVQRSAHAAQHAVSRLGHAAQRAVRMHGDDQRSDSNAIGSSWHHASQQAYAKADALIAKLFAPELDPSTAASSRARGHTLTGASNDKAAAEVHADQHDAVHPRGVLGTVKEVVTASAAQVHEHVRDSIAQKLHDAAVHVKQDL